MILNYIDTLKGLISVVEMSKCKNFACFQLPTIDAKCHQLRFATTNNGDSQEEAPLFQFRLDPTMIEDNKIELCCESLEELVEEFDKRVFDMLYSIGEKVEVYEIDSSMLALQGIQIAINTRRGQATAILSPFEIDCDLKNCLKYVDETRKDVLMAYRGKFEYDGGLTIIPISYQFIDMSWKRNMKGDLEDEKDEYKLSFYMCAGPNPEKYIRVIKGNK